MQTTKKNTIWCTKNNNAHHEKEHDLAHEKRLADHEKEHDLVHEEQQSKPRKSARLGTSRNKDRQKLTSSNAPLTTQKKTYRPLS